MDSDHMQIAHDINAKQRTGRGSHERLQITVPSNQQRSPSIELAASLNQSCTPRGSDRFDLHQLARLVWTIIDDERNVSTLADKPVLSRCERRGKDRRSEVLRKCDGHERSVGLASALHAKHRVRLPGYQALYSLAYRGLRAAAWLRLVPAIEQWLVDVHCYGLVGYD